MEVFTVAASEFDVMDLFGRDGRLSNNIGEGDAPPSEVGDLIDVLSEVGSLGSAPSEVGAEEEGNGEVFLFKMSANFNNSDFVVYFTKGPIGLFLFNKISIRCSVVALKCSSTEARGIGTFSGINRTVSEYLVE